MRSNLIIINFKLEITGGGREIASPQATALYYCRDKTRFTVYTDEEMSPLIKFVCII